MKFWRANFKVVLKLSAFFCMQEKMFKKNLDLETYLKKKERELSNGGGRGYKFWLGIVFAALLAADILFSFASLAGYGPAAALRGILAEHDLEFVALGSFHGGNSGRDSISFSGTGHLNTAENWYQIAAADGSVYGMYRLGKLLCEHSSEVSGNSEKNAATGLFWLENAAQMGSEDAMLMAGKLHHGGRIGGTDLKKAKFYFSMACKKGSEEGCRLEYSIR